MPGLGVQSPWLEGCKRPLMWHWGQGQWWLGSAGDGGIFLLCTASHVQGHPGRAGNLWVLEGTPGKSSRGVLCFPHRQTKGKCAECLCSPGCVPRQPPHPADNQSDPVLPQTRESESNSLPAPAGMQGCVTNIPSQITGAPKATINVFTAGAVTKAADPCGTPVPAAFKAPGTDSSVFGLCLGHSWWGGGKVD